MGDHLGMGLRKDRPLKEAETLYILIIFNAFYGPSALEDSDFVPLNESYLSMRLQM
jgi:hypothetical protein